ncbi:centrosomal protein of 63 kDa isoform X9 [Pipistrellus kuhlii]|uniref:centrosomal protein of 63 kDa isoform X9 n=2 Tax=Pipistrellus kuhlii TaxID=59472 RepID=UPI001E274BF1|nr:centrosomal protein of 63 kDa isoform X9 [Pipistrellus kuhlii]
MCARKMGEGRACPSPEAALAAAEPSAVRVYGPGLASAAARRPAGPPPPRRARPGAPPLVLAAYGRRTRGGGHGLAGRAVGASQTTVMSWWPNNLQSCQNKGDLAMEALLEGIQNRGHDGGFLTSCEAELQELMKQIDIMVAHKKSEWEGQTHALETCLDIREQELKSLRSQLDMKHKEVGMLRQQVEEHEKVKHEMAMDYKQELKKLQEELGRLKRSYEKLQKKQIRDFRGNTKNHRDDRSEIERLTGKIEEYRQKSLDWEKQRLIYQQQVSSLEAQRKALAEQSEIIQAQLVNRKQKLESVELSRQSEIQHLSSKLERANDTICANELEIERLTMRVNDLVGTNKTVIQEQRQKEEKLRESEKMLEVLQEEKRQLKATLHSQENFIHDTKMQKETLQAKLRATDIQHTVEVIRSLEESQTERQYTTHEQDLDNVLSQLDLTHTSEELLQAEVTRLESSLESVSITCKQLSQELMEKYEELKKMEVHNNEYRAEIKKLKEQILQADQSYSSALEGMKLEISQLTRELHQRDVTIASAKSSSSDMEKRLKAEIQKAEEKAVEHKEILDQLESLKLENRHLSEMVKKLEVGLHECTTAVSPLGSIATRFLEEEELRSHHILERLDAHIEELKRESEKTVRQFTTLK